MVPFIFIDSVRRERIIKTALAQRNHFSNTKYNLFPLKQPLPLRARDYLQLVGCWEVEVNLLQQPSLLKLSRRVQENYLEALRLHISKPFYADKESTSSTLPVLHYTSSKLREDNGVCSHSIEGAE